MNKFGIFSCVKVNENDYKGPCVLLACTSDPSFILFFPISEDNASVISYILSGNKDYDINTSILGIYKTMIDSWKSSDRYLSGIIMDSVYDSDRDNSILTIRLALADHDGFIDSLVRVNFLHAILLAAMEKVDLIVSDDLIAQMMPPSYSEEADAFPDDLFPMDDDDDDDDEDEDVFEVTPPPPPRRKRTKLPPLHEDRDIVEIARKIMSGKIKDKDDKEADKDADAEKDGDAVGDKDKDD